MWAVEELHGPQHPFEMLACRSCCGSEHSPSLQQWGGPVGWLYWIGQMCMGAGFALAASRGCAGSMGAETTLQRHSCLGTAQPSGGRPHLT